jgi:hypothetical protein
MHVPDPVTLAALLTLLAAGAFRRDHDRPAAGVVHRPLHPREAR